MYIKEKHVAISFILKCFQVLALRNWREIFFIAHLCVLLYIVYRENCRFTSFKEEKKTLKATMDHVNLEKLLYILYRQNLGNYSGLVI